MQKLWAPALMPVETFTILISYSFPTLRLAETHAAALNDPNVFSCNGNELKTKVSYSTFNVHSENIFLPMTSDCSLSSCLEMLT